MTHEEKARGGHQNGYNCAMSVFSAYAEELGLSTREALETAPKPRSDGGKCGAFLAGRTILERLKPEATAEFQRRFCQLNGQTECRALIASHGRLKKSCNDYVGDASRLVEELLKQD